MKLLFLLLALTLPLSAERSVTFAWDKATDADSYTLYINGVPAGTTTETQIIVQIPDGKTLANVTGVNLAGESEKPIAGLTLNIVPAEINPWLQTFALVAAIIVSTLSAASIIAKNLK